MQAGLDTTLTALWPILQTRVHMQSQQLQLRALIITASDLMYCKMTLSAYKIIFRYQIIKEHESNHWGKGLKIKPEKNIYNNNNIWADTT